MDEQALRNIELLADELQRSEQARNVVPLHEFFVFRELFLKDSQERLDQDQIRKLSTEFIRRFNPYQPIIIVGSNNEELFRVPQLFVPIKDISSDYEDLLCKFYADGPSEIPRYSSEATAGLLTAILKSQTDVAERGFKSYGDYIRALSKEYHDDVARFSQQTTEAQTETKEIGTDANIDRVPGLSWE